MPPAGIKRGTDDSERQRLTNQLRVHRLYTTERPFFTPHHIYACSFRPKQAYTVETLKQHWYDVDSTLRRWIKVDKVLSYHCMAVLSIFLAETTKRTHITIWLITFPDQASNPLKWISVIHTPVVIWCQNDVVLTLIWRHHVVSTLIRRLFRLCDLWYNIYLY